MAVSLVGSHVRKHNTRLYAQKKSRRLHKKTQIVITWAGIVRPIFYFDFPFIYLDLLFFYNLCSQSVLPDTVGQARARRSVRSLSFSESSCLDGDQQEQGPRAWQGSSQCGSGRETGSGCPGTALVVQNSVCEDGIRVRRLSNHRSCTTQFSPADSNPRPRLPSESAALLLPRVRRGVLRRWGASAPHHSNPRLGSGSGYKGDRVKAERLG